MRRANSTLRQEIFQSKTSEVTNWMLLEPDEVAEVAHCCLTPSKARSKDDIASIAVYGHGVNDTFLASRRQARFISSHVICTLRPLTLRPAPARFETLLPNSCDVIAYLRFSAKTAKRETGRLRHFLFPHANERHRMPTPECLDVANIYAGLPQVLEVKVG